MQHLPTATTFFLFNQAIGIFNGFDVELEQNFNGERRFVLKILLLLLFR